MSLCVQREASSCSGEEFGCSCDSRVVSTWRREEGIVSGHLPPASLISFVTDTTGGYPGGVPVRIRAAMDQGTGSQLSPLRREPLRAVGLHPLPKWSHCTEAGSKKYINIIGQRNGGVAARLVNSRSGRTSRPGDPRPNPQGAGTDWPYFLLSNQSVPSNQHSVVYVPLGTLRIVRMALLTEPVPRSVRQV